jgi:hypothetical protein
MHNIGLTKNKVAIIDDVDLDLALLSWYATRAGYAARSEGRRINRKIIYLHRRILERKIGRRLSPSEICDHTNGDRLDNRRDNLRIATLSQSVQNTSKKRGKTPYKGIYYSEDHSSWCAKIMSGRHNKHIGYFDTPEAAARGYDYWAIKYHGDFAKLNFPGEENQTAHFWEQTKVRSKRGSQSGLRCVYKNGNKWGARYTIGGKRIFLGNFDNPEDASRAYTQAIAKETD